MTIGIMTFWWSDDNYGQILQCYALQKYLRDAGHDAYLIRYDPRNDYMKTPFWKKIVKGLNPVKLTIFLRYKAKKIIDKQEKSKHSRNFQEFKDKHIKQSEKIYYTHNELLRDPPDADVYIVGSDQVWNFYAMPLSQIKSRLYAYFLNFGIPTTKRIAYAASFGRECLDAVFIQEITPLLKKFNYVSVREKAGLSICRQCGVENAEWAPDPTMLLNVNIYRSLYNSESIIKQEKPYCLLYMLGNKHNFSIQKIYDWAKKKKINVTYISGNKQQDKYKKNYATIQEWLYLIDHAEYVITNSYHCSIFSLIFNKKIGIIPLEGNFIGMNSRLESLFELFQMDQRFINETIDIIEKDINWGVINNIFNQISFPLKLNDILQKENE
jgi:hypothetical protein